MVREWKVIEALLILLCVRFKDIKEKIGIESKKKDIMYDTSHSQSIDRLWLFSLDIGVLLCTSDIQ